MGHESDFDPPFLSDPGTSTEFEGEVSIDIDPFLRNRVNQAGARAAQILFDIGGTVAPVSRKSIVDPRTGTNR